MGSFVEPAAWRHHTTELSPSLKLHHVEADPSSPPNGHTIVLIHGYPQTWYAFRHVLQPLADAGYRVLAVDYRGAGDSSAPAYGYDKATMAADVHTLCDLRGVERPIVLGHDIGSMVAVFYALRYPVEALVCGVPGTAAFELVTTDDAYKWTRVFHFFFHCSDGLPETLTAGKERAYLQNFYARSAYNPAFLTDSDESVSAFERPGAMRAGFELYRAFRADRAAFGPLVAERGRVRAPCLALAGEHSWHRDFTETMTAEFAHDVSCAVVAGSNHYLAEENPTSFVGAVLGFLREHGL